MFSNYVNIMFKIIFLCGILSIVSAKLKDQEAFRLQPDTVLKAYKLAIPCIEENKADPDSLRKLFDSKLPNDDSSKQFLFCFSRRGSFVDEEGHFNIERMLTFIGNHRLAKPFVDTLAECNKITKENPVETTYEMSYCLNNNSPVVFAL